MRNDLGCLLILLHINLSGTREVSSPPYMVKQPSRIIVIEEKNDEPLYMECEAIGDPAPKYYWMKNGKPFLWQTYDDRISQQTGRGTLSISKPSDVDLGQYQCFAENPYGIAISNSVFIHKADLDFLKTKLPMSVAGYEGKPLNFTYQLDIGWHWICFYTNGNFEITDISQISRDENGNLLVSNFTRQDITDNFIFACGGVILTKYEFKYRDMILLNVVPSGGGYTSLNKHEPVLQYVTRNSTVAYRGRHVQLYCVFGGTPRPKIVWSKNGKSVQSLDQIEVRNDGKSILIWVVDFEDEGSYTCEVSNGVGEAKSHTINLKVLAVPYFTEEPERVVAGENETIQFNCKAEGVPEPEINWTHNGKPIAEAPHNPRRKVFKNKIIIERLIKNDTGNYGCNATNSIGYVYKDVYLNVLDQVPEIIEGPKDTQAVDNANVNMTCRALGLPKPNVKWIHNEKELTGGRYQIQENGDLLINAVQFEDSGNYTCYAENKVGNTSVSAKLDVKAHTYITDGPEYYKVRAGSPATLRCNAVADDSLNLEILWSKNNQLIRFGTDSKFVKSSDYSLTIVNTTTLYSGTYTCLAKTELDETSAEVYLIIEDVPNPPAITGVKCYAKIASISWVPMGDNGAPISFYIIQYNTSFTPEEWKDAYSHASAAEMTYKVPMSPWANYSFRVIAINKIGPSAPSRRSDVCTTLPEVPHKNPDNVKGEGDQPDNLVITWTPMPQIEHNGPGIRYRVYWKLLIAGKDYDYKEILDYKEDRLVIPNQPSFKQYKIKVIAINEVGESDVSPQEVIGYSGEDEPEEAPTNFTLLNVLSPTAALLSWDPIPLNSVRGHFKGYKIKYWSESIPNIYREIQIHAGTSKAIIKRFEPYTMNFAQVYVFNGRYDGPPSETLSFLTSEGVPGPIQYLQAIPLGASAFLLKWHKPVEPNGILTGYNIYYAEVSNSVPVHPPVPRNSQINDPNTMQAKLGGLKSDTEYRIYISATTAAGESKRIFIDRKTDPAGTIKPSKPRFEYDVIENDIVPAVRIYWIPSEDGYPGSYFYVKYKKGEIQYLSVPEKDEDFIIIPDLDIATTYEFIVTSVDGTYQTDSEPQEIST